MLFDERCMAGKLQVDDTEIRVVGPFKKVVWSAPRATVTRISQKPAIGLMTDIELATTTGVYTATIATRKVKSLFALFPGLDSTGIPWYLDQTRPTHVAAYKDGQVMRREIETAALNGWTVQSSVTTSRTTVTVTFARIPQR